MKGSGYALEQVKGEAKGSQKVSSIALGKFAFTLASPFCLPDGFCRMNVAGGIEVMDLIYIAVTIVFFEVSAAYVRACDRL